MTPRPAPSTRAIPLSVIVREQVAPLQQRAKDAEAQATYWRQEAARAYAERSAVKDALTVAERELAQLRLTEGRASRQIEINKRRRVCWELFGWNPEPKKRRRATAAVDRVNDALTELDASRHSTKEVA